MPKTPLNLALAVSTAAAILPSGALAQSPPPSYGIDFARIGSPGNRATIPNEVPTQPEMQVGAVSYEYRIARTELTATQWLGFVQAYAPYWTGSPSDPSFTSWWIEPGTQGYQIDPGAEQYPVVMSWRMAARYCNWLTNGKGSERSAFESGAYDTSTFTANPDGSLNDQITHSPGALFWIPTRNEWTKAAFYDPNRNGTGGYWRFPDASDQAPISGLPGEGGQTNAGGAFPGDPIAMAVGSYPSVQSPWGLLDLSGGVREWTEDIWFSADSRWSMGSRIRDSQWYDMIDWWGNAASPQGFGSGLRIASSLPEPGGLIILGVGWALRKRRRNT